MNVADFAATVAGIVEAWAVVREAVNGYRAQLIADGYSETAAERMAIDLHASIWRQQ